MKDISRKLDCDERADTEMKRQKDGSKRILGGGCKMTSGFGSEKKNGQRVGASLCPFKPHAAVCRRGKGYVVFSDRSPESSFEK